MTHLLAIIAMVIGTGVFAKFFPKAMTLLFDRFPEHFAPQTTEAPPQHTDNTPPQVISRETVIAALQNTTAYKQPRLLGPGDILIPHRESAETHSRTASR